MLQELKVTEDKFPFELLQTLGYHAAVYGQPTYNGVAIVSRLPIDHVQRGFADGAHDEQARAIFADVAGVRVASLYVPNGSEVGSEKYLYKLDWLQRLHRFLREQCQPGAPWILGGDFNIAPEDRDVARPDQWEHTVLCDALLRQTLRAICEWGLHDSFRVKIDEGGHYSWWDYRKLAFPMNDGLRIDQIYVTKPLVQSIHSVFIDRNERKGPQPSDHVPVVVDLDLASTRG